ncbi:hypothetical protein [Endozoicomonas sp. YOMI1]|uniref:hypothetical protein n=1 Tax=Endozoicomonas sp. YOMI1 TaxID=2828739 RepID=UPI0021498880|nr:hypothetical protein [Endozoicomonas sp. YOMI1]
MTKIASKQRKVSRKTQARSLERRNTILTVALDWNCWKRALSMSFHCTRWRKKPGFLHHLSITDGMAREGYTYLEFIGGSLQ